MFSGGIEKQHWAVMGESSFLNALNYYNKEVATCVFLVDVH